MPEVTTRKARRSEIQAWRRLKPTVVCAQNEADAYRKIRLRCEDVQGRNVLTNFWVSYIPCQTYLIFWLDPRLVQGLRALQMRGWSGAQEGPAVAEN